MDDSKVHLARGDGISRCGHVVDQAERRTGYWQYGVMTSDIDKVTCKHCLSYATGCKHPTSGVSDRERLLLDAFDALMALVDAPCDQCGHIRTRPHATGNVGQTPEWRQSIGNDTASLR